MKRVKKSIALALIIGLLFSVIPTAAAASMVATENDLSADESAPASEEVYAISELVEERTENSKRFLMSDHSVQAVIYSNPVHYQTDGKWQDIDNTLQDDSISGDASMVTVTDIKAINSATSSVITPTVINKDDFDGTVNRANNLKVKIAKNANAKKLIRLQTDDYAIAWGYNPSKNTKHKKSASKAVVSAQEKSDDLIYNSVAKSVQKVTFPDIDKQCDFEYIIAGNHVKENIVVKAKTSRYTYSFEMQVKNLALTLESDGSISCKNARGEAVFTIPAPYMYDAKGNVSYGVQYELIQKNTNQYNLTITPDTQWMNADERAFPVVIDPYVMTEQRKTAMDTAFITSSMASTNHHDKAELLVGMDSSSYGKCRAMVQFELPALSAGDMVVDAKMCFAAWVSNNSFYTEALKQMQVNAHMITSSWNNKTVTWNTSPSYQSTVLDYDYITRADINVMNWKYFNITKAVKQWYEGTSSNNGILLKSSNESTNYAESGIAGKLFSERYQANTTALPAIIITYRNNKGLEDYWTYTTASAGTAGTVYVNDYTGNLVVVHDDVTTSGLLMPITIQHVYNGYMYNKAAFSEIKPKMGHGWRLNIEQTVGETAKISGFNAETAKQYPYVYTDGDGTEHYFYKKTENGVTRYLDEDGLRLELKKTTSGYTIENSVDKNSQDKKLVYTFNASGNLTQIKDSNGNTMKIVYSGNTIQKVYDGSGHCVEIKENTETGSGNIRSMTGPGNEITYFYFNEKGLSQIKYPDGTHSDYDYDSSGALTSIKSMDGSRLSVGYTTAAKGKRVSYIQEFGTDGSIGQRVRFDRSAYNTTYVTTNGNDGLAGNADDVTTTYQFDSFGRTVSQQVKSGSTDYGAAAYEYTAGRLDSSASNMNQLNRVQNAASLSRNINNFAINGGGEASGSWTSARWVDDCNYVFTNTTVQKYYGKQSMMLTSTSVTGDGRARIYQDFSTSVLKPGKKYTFSVYVKTSGIAVANGTDNGTNCGACMNINVFTTGNANNVSQYAELITGTTDTAVNDGWVRLSTTVTIPATATSTRLNLAIRNATGTAYFDGVQVEESDVEHNVNLLENSSFENGSGTPTSWTGSNLSATDTVSTAAAKNGSKSMKIVGNASAKKEIYQEVPVSGSEHDTYIVSGWAKADSVAITNFGGDRKFKISIDVIYTDNTTVSKSPAEFNCAVSDWQYTCKAFDLSDGTSANKTPSKIRIRVRYWCEANTAYFDNIQLIKDVAQTYTYDKDGNMVNVAQNAKNQSSLQYTNTDLIKDTDVNGNSFTYTYDGRHNLTKATSQRGVTYEYAYNSYGDATSLTVKNPDKSMAIQTTAAYTANGAYVSSTKDEVGNVTQYSYDQNSGELSQVRDACSVPTLYDYDASHRLISVNNSYTPSKINYTYDSKGRLSTIDNNANTKYSFTYDAYGNRTGTSIKGQSSSYTLATNTYKANNNGLQTVTYGNGTKVEYDYNALGGVTEKKINGTGYYQWYYDSNSIPIMYVDDRIGLCYNYTYDSIGRLVRQKASTPGNNGSGNDRVYATELGYDALNNVTKLATTAGKRTQKITYQYNAKDNLPTQSYIYSNRTIDFSYDSLNRMNKRTITTDTPVYMGYLYRMSERNGTNETLYRTRQIHQEFIGDTAYRYTYDAVGNITKIEVGERKTKGSSESVAVNYTLLAEYQYDDDYQLYRENNKQLNKTIIYDYSHGNRTTRREYAFSQESFPTTSPLKTTTYTYGDDVWGDLLTGISEGSGSQSITYDKIGNPTAYKGYTMTWTGRELTGLSGNGLYASFKYDADGLRTEKAAGGVTSKYYYVGGKLYYEKRGAKELYYFYDSIGNLAMIRYYTGSGEENYNYYVATNSRGDVEAIYRGNGTIKARYIYDTWGKVISVVNENGQEITSQNDIGLINPIRYRGYYYDQETGYYYLQSRYYDPDTGRFLNGDGYANTGVGVLGTNMFTYCGNNPINMTDSAGMCPYNGTVADFHRAEHGLPSLDCTCNKPSPFKNKDGSYSLYDNRRHDPSNIFHEQILSGKVSKPSWDVKNNNYGIGSISGTAYNGGWEWEHVNLSLLDFGTAKVSAQFKDKTLSVGAMASIWTPSFSVKIWDVNITLSAHMGSVGWNIHADSKGFNFDGAVAWGFGLSVTW